MPNEEMIMANEFCRSHDIEISFVNELCDAGLLQVTKIEDAVFITYDQLPDLEKLVRWRYEMDINMEGIEAIHHLLEQMKEMQEKLRTFRNRLSLYEKVEGQF